MILSFFPNLFRAAFRRWRWDLPGALMAVILLVSGAIHLREMSFPLQVFFLLSIPAIGMQIQTRKTTLGLASVFSTAGLLYFVFLSKNETDTCLAVFYVTYAFLAIGLATSYRFAGKRANEAGELQSTLWAIPGWAMIEPDGSVRPVW